MSDQLPHFRFARDWYQYSQDEIDLILEAMRGTVRLTHEEHYCLTKTNQRPPAADRSLLLAVLADVVSYQWTKLDDLERQVSHLTQAVARLEQKGSELDRDTPDPDARDDHDPRELESPRGPA